MAEYKITLSSNDLYTMQEGDYVEVESIVQDILKQAKEQGYKGEVDADEQEGE